MSELQGINYEAVIADLEAKKDTIDKAIVNLRQLISLGVLGTQGAGAFVSTEYEGAAIPDDFFFGMGIADAAKKYLSAVRKTKTTREIADALEGGGLTHASQDFTKTVSTVLNTKLREESDEIVKVKDKWGLISWYKGMKKKVKSKNGQAVEVVDENADLIEELTGSKSMDNP